MSRARRDHERVMVCQDISGRCLDGGQDGIRISASGLCHQKGSGITVAVADHVVVFGWCLVVCVALIRLGYGRCFLFGYHSRDILPRLLLTEHRQALPVLLQFKPGCEVYDFIAV